MMTLLCRMTMTTLPRTTMIIFKCFYIFFATAVVVVVVIGLYFRNPSQKGGPHSRMSHTQRKLNTCVASELDFNASKSVRVFTIRCNRSFQCSAFILLSSSYDLRLLMHAVNIYKVHSLCVRACVRVRMCLCIKQ